MSTALYASCLILLWPDSTRFPDAIDDLLVRLGGGGKEAHARSVGSPRNSCAYALRVSLASTPEHVRSTTYAL
jgi:hypothetical protein